MSHYVFIDGHYFAEAYSQMMTTFYGEVAPIDYPALSLHFGKPDRIYYYDAVDRNRVGSESDTEMNSRIAERDNFHAYLNSLRTWNVREGFVSRGRRAKRREQKGVDVQLAVDALEHAVARNITRATFVFGDLDFEPLLFSLNRQGVTCSVWYEHGTASAELLEAADDRRQITVRTCWDIAQELFRQRALQPTITLAANPPNYPVLGSGTWRGRRVQYSAKNTLNMANLFVEPGPDPIREPSITVHLSTAAHLPGMTDSTGRPIGEEKVRQLFLMTHGGEIENWVRR